MTFFHLHPSPSPAAASAWAIYRQLDRSQWLTPADIERNQLAAPDALLAHCAEHVPDYQRLLPELGLTLRPSVPPSLCPSVPEPAPSSLPPESNGVGISGSVLIMTTPSSVASGGRPGLQDSQRLSLTAL
jgi:hypothetical protein